MIVVIFVAVVAAAVTETDTLRGVKKVKTASTWRWEESYRAAALRKTSRSEVDVSVCIFISTGRG